MIYELEGLTPEIINQLNLLKNRTIVKLKNTNNITSTLVNTIYNNRILFNINNNELSSSGLGLILSYFENIESMLNPEWNNLAIAMYIYACVVENTEYTKQIDSLIMHPERNLNGLLYNQLDKVGFTIVLKELFERHNIPCITKEINNNAICIITIDNKYYALDPYADNRNLMFNKGKCNYSFFGRKNNYTNELSLSILSDEELKHSFITISQSLLSTKIKRFDILSHPESTQEEYLPLNITNKHLADEANHEYLYYITYQFLSKRNLLTINPCLINAFNKRINYIYRLNNDYQRNTVEMRDIGISVFGTQCYITPEGNIFNHERENRFVTINNIIGSKEEVPQSEINKISESLNLSLTTFINDFLKKTINDINVLFSEMEPITSDMDKDRLDVQDNIKTKLLFLIESKNYLIQTGYDPQEITFIIERINAKLK